ncbi:MAG: pyridoxamine 5'-phosphate oxidase family protein [Kurthia sp.]
MAKSIDLEKHRQNYKVFLEGQKTIMISSLDPEGEPFLSYSPFVFDDGKFYIYISKITEHYHYINAHPKVTIMTIADEVNSPNLFARERVRFQCEATIVEESEYERVFDKFNERNGKPMMGVLRGLDFSLFELTPNEGRYVVGFGLAFHVDVKAEQFSHVVIDKK